MGALVVASAPSAAPKPPRVFVLSAWPLVVASAPSAAPSAVNQYLR
jgi:hypothetical protein